MNHKLKQLFTCILITLVFTVASGVKPCAAQFTNTSLKLVCKRPPQLDLSSYKKIAIGDFVGPTGAKTVSAMDLADAVTSKLFNSNSYEIIDRNALYELLGSQRDSEMKTITEATTAALSKKLNSAVIILGRIQEEKVNKEEKSAKNGGTSCPYSYWWHVTGRVTAQIKILDVKNGKMLYSNPVSQDIDFKTKMECAPYRLSDDVSSLIRETTNKLVVKIAQIAVPYEETVDIEFENQAVTIFKNPFKKLANAIACFEVKDNDNGLSILKTYAEDKSLKDNLKEKAIYNYGVGLFLSGQDELAIEKIQQANALGSSNAVRMLEIIENERVYRNKLKAFNDKLAATAALPAETPVAAPASSSKPAKKTKAPAKRVKP